MGLVFRQSIATTIISYLGVIVGFVNVVYLYPRFMEPEQIGLLRTIQDAAILFAPFAQFGIAQTVIKYYPYFSQDKKQSGSFLSLVLMFALAGFTLFFIAFTIFKGTIVGYFENNAPEFIGYTSLAIWLTLILLLTSVLEAFSRSLFRTVIPNLLREVVLRLLYAGLVTLYFLGYLTYDQFVTSTVAASLFCLVLLISYLWRSGDFNLRLPFSSVQQMPPGMLRYSLTGFAGTAGMIIIGKIDSLMVSAMLGFAFNAVYTTAFYMATVIEIPKRALSQVAMPLIARAFERNDLQEVRTLYHKTAINQFIVGTLLLLGVWANLDNIFALMPKADIYAAGRYVVLIIGIGKLVDMIFGPSSEIIVLSQHYWFNIVLILLLAIVIVSANTLLIPRYGIEGAAAGSALTLIIFNVIKFIFIWVKMGLQPFSPAFLKVILIGAIAWGIDFIIPRIDYVILDMAVRSAAITLAFGSLVLWTNVSPEANGIFRKGMDLIGK